MEKPKYKSDKPSCVLCGPTNENRQILFRFPKSPDRQEAWKSFARIQTIKSRSRLCELHFRRDQLVQTRLRKDAIPTVDSPSVLKSADPPSSMNLVKILPRPRLPLGQVFMNSQDALLHKEIKTADPIDLIRSSPTVVINAYDEVILPNNTKRSPETDSPSDGNRTIPMFIDPAQTTPSKMTAGQLMIFTDIFLDDPNKKNKQNQSRDKVNKLRYKLRRVRRKNKDLTDLNKLFSGNPLFLKFLTIQVERSKNNRKFYTSFEKSMALSLFYSCGRNGYRLLTELGIKLPTTRALRKWMECFNCTPGKNEEILMAIKQLTVNFSSHERDCIITWDEMSIKQLIEYNRSSDNLEGIVDLGTGLSRKRLEPANEVLVFMIQGISSKWKFPISFYFSNNATKAVDLEALVKDNIEKVYSIGLKVRVCICDQAFTNQSLYRKWGIYSDGPLRYFGENKIYCIHDTTHLIKLVRNNLLKYDFYATKRVGNHIKSERIRWLHLGTFFNKDRRVTARMAPKLTKGHIILKDFSKMKVRLATQLFSASVYAGMMTMIKLGVMKTDAMATAKFVKKIDDLFDLLNISKYSQDKPSRCARTLFDNLNRFDEHVKLVKSLELRRYPGEPMFLKGLEVTLQGIKLLCLDLKNEGYTHVFTRQLQQDCLENFFSAVKMKGGFCRNPTARQFRINFKYLFLARLLRNPGTGNTEGNHNRLANILETVSKISHSSVTIDNISDEEKSIQQVLLRKKSKRKLKFGTEQEVSVMSYFGPACVINVNHKNRCKRCDEMLYKVESINDSLLSHYKQGEGTANLSALNESTEKVFIYLNQKFDEYFYCTLSNGSENICMQIFKMFTSDTIISDWISDECKQHKLEILSYFIRTKLYRVLKDKNEDFRQVKSWNQSRRDQRDQ